MATKTARTVASPLQMLTARQVANAVEGDLVDGGGLVLRVSGERASWVLRYTAPTGKRREMGLGVAYRGSLVQAGDTLAKARDAAAKARDLLRDGIDPLVDRDKKREAERQAEAARKAEKAKDHWTLARAARDYHQRVIEPTRTAKHGAALCASALSPFAPAHRRDSLADTDTEEGMNA